MRARAMRDTRFSQLWLTPRTVGCRRRERPGHRAAAASVAPCTRRPAGASRVRRAGSCRWRAVRETVAHRRMTVASAAGPGSTALTTEPTRSVP